MDEAEVLCDRVAIMDSGKIIPLILLTVLLINWWLPDLKDQRSEKGEPEDVLSR
jgi:hypothetical protein